MNKNLIIKEISELINKLKGKIVTLDGYMIQEISDEKFKEINNEFIEIYQKFAKYNGGPHDDIIDTYNTLYKNALLLSNRNNNIYVDLTEINKSLKKHYYKLLYAKYQMVINEIKPLIPTFTIDSDGNIKRYEINGIKIIKNN